MGAFYIGSMIIQPLYVGGLITLIKTWKEWQTFNAGMIAILAAIIGAYVALKLDKSARQREAVKVRESRQHEREKLRAQQKAISEQRSREFIAASAFLPASLTSINEYIIVVSKKLLRLFAVKRSGNSNDLKRYIDEIQALSVPDGYQGAFKECITLSTPDMSKHLVYILVHLQVFSSRMNAIDYEHLGDRYLEEMLIDSIRFQFKIDSLYDFAREGSAISEMHRDVESYYLRISRLLDYQVQIKKGENHHIDRLVDSAARRD